jgi:hypothetical protein
MYWTFSGPADEFKGDKDHWLHNGHSWTTVKAEYETEARNLAMLQRWGPVYSDDKVPTRNGNGLHLIQQLSIEEYEEAKTHYVADLNRRQAEARATQELSRSKGNSRSRNQSRNEPNFPRKRDQA